MFSVIVPAYNAARFLEETAQSVLRQSLEAWELIVVDDGSTDDTAQVAAALAGPRVRVLSQANQGVSAARNRGLHAATGSHVLFLDSDDALSPNALERFSVFFEEHPEVVAAYGEATVMNEAGALTGTGKPPVFQVRPSGEALTALLARNPIVTTGAICLRRAPLVEIGGFREDLRVAEDWELWCRVALSGPIGYLGGAPVVAYRIRANSAMRGLGLSPEEAVKSVDAIFANPQIVKRIQGDAAPLREQALGAVFSFTATVNLRNRHFAQARKLLWQSIRRNPRQTREWILYACSCLRWLPSAIERRLK